MIAHRFVSLIAAALITSLQWAVFFHPHWCIDARGLAQAAMVAQSSVPASGGTDG